MVARTLTAALETAVRSFPVVTVTGPRQSGKTTLLRAAFPDYHYVNLEAVDQRRIAEEDPRGLIGRHLERGIVIDEAQRVPDLFSYVQTIVDERRTIGKVILSGSQHFLLLERITQSLAGRAMVLHLHPFTVLELPAVLGEPADTAMFNGMYPPLHDRRIAPAAFYPTYIQSYVERDVRSVRNVGDLSTFSRFLQLCAGRIGSLLNLSALANELGVDHKTVRAWLSVLEASFVVFMLPPYHRNYNKRVVKQPKLYFYDTGLACSLLGLESEHQLPTHYLRGGIFENFVVAEYRKIVEHTGRRPHMFFWRDNTGTEVDLVVEHGPRVDAVEIKSGATLNQEFTRSLRKFQTYSSIAPERCHLVYGGEVEHAGEPARVWSWRHLPDWVDAVSR
jgi:uncharacterized protein